MTGRTRIRANRAAGRGGFSLLEVILALAILIGALVVIGNMIHTGFLSSQAAVAATQAELLAESTLAEVIAGELPMETAIGVTFLEAPEFVYSVLVDSSTIDEQGMLVVTVTVEPEPGRKIAGGKFTVTRWVRDPAVVEAAQAAEESAAESAASSSTSSSSGASSSGN